jgi:hypothetical protein
MKFRKLSASGGDFGSAFPNVTSRAGLEDEVIRWAASAETDEDRQFVANQVSYLLGAGAVRGDKVGHLATPF